MQREKSINNNNDNHIPLSFYDSSLGFTQKKVSRSYWLIIFIASTEGYPLGIAEHNVITAISLYISMFYVALMDCVLFNLYYHWRKGTHLLQTQWMSQLQLMDKINKTQELPWTLRYGTWISNTKFLIILSMIYIICVTCIAILVAEFTNSHIAGFLTNLVGAISSIIVIIPACLLFFKSRKFIDPIGVKTQIRGTGIIAFITALLLSIDILAVPLTPYRGLITYSILTWGTNILCLRMLWFKQLSEYIDNQLSNESIIHSDSVTYDNDRYDPSTQTTTTRQPPQQQQPTKSEKNSTSFFGSFGSFGSFSGIAAISALERDTTLSTSTKPVNKPVTVKFADAWRDQQLFNSFANHLVTEYSVFSFFHF